MMKVYIERLILDNYRNFSNLELTFNNNIIVIIGENGSGKTNILESISLFSPGKGLRGVRYEEISHNNKENWSNVIYLQSKIGKALLESNFLSSTNARIIEYNGTKIRSSELGNFANIIWLTPQMDGIFLSSASERRRFLDRIVYNFHPDHASNINKYDYLVSERLKILSHAQSNFDESLLRILETKIANIALKINRLRLSVVYFLQQSIATVDAPFPKAKLDVSLLFENKVEDEEFLHKYLANLNQNRQKDKFTKRTNFGINKQELIVQHQEKGQLAKFCSTGEQKALLISILLGQIEANKTIAKTSPILLLDELFVHLDEVHKSSLAEYIINSKLQTFITTTDMSGLDKIAAIAQTIYLGRKNNFSYN